MITTGFKFYFGLAAAFFVGAIAWGYSTGGEHVGPLTLGWKGGVGDHVGYLVLIGLGFATACFAGIIIAFRDADPAAQAHYMGVETIVSTTPTTGSFWPVVAAFGAAIMLVGLVLTPVMFVAGIVMIVLAGIEWMMDAWADRATGDPVANKALRDQVMAPFEIPIGGAIGVAIMALAVSRIFLTVSKNGAVAAAGVISIIIFGLGILYAAKPKMNRNVMAGLVLATGLLVVGGGIVAAVQGEREIEHHGDKYGEDQSDEGEHSE